MDSVVPKNSSSLDWIGAAAAWAYSIFIGLGGLAILVEHQLAPGVLFLLSALMTFPPVSKLLRQANFRIRTWPKVSGAIVLLLAGATLLPKPPEAQASHPSEVAFTPAAQGIAVAKLLLLDDFKGYLEGSKVVGDWSGIYPLGQKVSASQLFIAYHENEVAADDQFKGKSLVVVGSVDSINKDIFNNVYLVLRDANAFEGVHASLTDDSMKSAGQLSRGQNITLTCTGGGMIIGSPILKDCNTVNLLISLNRGKIENIVDQFFANDHDQPDSIRSIIGFGYAVGTQLPASNACQTATPGDMQGCTQAMRAIPAAERRREYAALSKHFPLPPLPEHSRAP